MSPTPRFPLPAGLPPLPARSTDVHKGDLGRILIVGASPGLTGAVVLASFAALRCGAGLVTCAIPESLNGIIETKSTEAMSLPLPQDPEGYLGKDAFAPLREPLRLASAVVLGPGLGRAAATTPFVAAVLEFLTDANIPHVIDADGLWHLAQLPHLLERGAQSRVLTPHDGETRRLLRTLGPLAATEEPLRETAVRRFEEIPGVLVLKGPQSWVVDCGGKTTPVPWQNSTGNPGMATGGTGDVLAGMVGAFLGRGEDAVTAARRGVWLHGLAGDLAATEVGQESLLASDLLARLPEALRGS